MSQEKNEHRVPKLRFKGFTDDWMQRELSDISDKVTAKNTKREYSNTLTNSASQGIVLQNDYFDKQISNNKNIDKYYIVEKNDFVYNPRVSSVAPYGPINRNKTGITGIMSPLYYVFKAKNINNDYLEYYFKSTKWHKFMYENGDTGARSDRFAISNKLFETMPIILPDKSEQAKIGLFLKKLDSVISLEHQKKESLLSLKGALYQYFFEAIENKHGLYFTEHQSTWSKINFNEIVDRSFKGTIKVSELEPGDTQYLDADRLNGGTPFYCNADPNVDEKDILILWDGSNAGKIYSGFNGVLGSTLKSYTLINDIDSEYIYHYLKSKEKLISHSYTTPNIPHVVKDFDKVFKILLPTYNEQVKIGRTLSHLDLILNNVEQKIIKYETIRKILLSNMFV